MDDQRHRPVSRHYPAPANHIIDDPTPKDQAIYIPSVSPGYAQAALAQAWTRPLPRGVQPGDLNFLDPGNGLFHISHVMSSAGQALKQTKDCIITQRDRTSTMLICDSGGYQIANRTLAISGDRDRMRILRWMEQHGDIGMTLDVPTGKAGLPGYGFKSSADCLTATLEHLDFFQKHRMPGKIRLLNVLQGNTPAETDTWYDAVKGYDFEGWAFAGKLRHNIHAFIRRIFIMERDGLIQDRDWIHVLGTCELDTAVLLTALQRAINRHLNPRLRISFDTSTPFRALAFGNIYTVPTFGRWEMTMPMRRMPDSGAFIGLDVRWPWPSPLGDRMTLGDVCVKASPLATSTYDTQANHYATHHNLAALCRGVALANRVFDGESLDHQHTIGHSEGEAVELIDRVFASGSMAQLNGYKKTFAKLRHSKIVDTGDEYRAAA